MMVEFQILASALPTNNSRLMITLKLQWVAKYRFFLGRCGIKTDQLGTVFAVHPDQTRDKTDLKFFLKMI